MVKKGIKSDFEFEVNSVKLLSSSKMLECQIGDVVIMSAESLSLDENVFD